MSYSSESDSQSSASPQSPISYDSCKGCGRKKLVCYVDRCSYGETYWDDLEDWVRDE